MNELMTGYHCDNCDKDFFNKYTVCPYCHNPLSQSEYVKVVRCRDCTKRKHGVWCAWSHRFVTDSGFCKWGERKVVE